MDLVTGRILLLPVPLPDSGTLDTTWAHLDLVDLVPIWASPSPGDFVPHLYLIALDCFLASPGTGESDPICASPRPGDSGPHLDMMTLDPLWASP